MPPTRTYTQIHRHTDRNIHTHQTHTSTDTPHTWTQVQTDAAIALTPPTLFIAILIQVVAAVFMRALLRSLQGESQESSSSVEQPVQMFNSIADVNRWLTVQDGACNAADFHKLRAAVSVLTKGVKPGRREVSLLCSSWHVRQYKDKQRRPLASLIKEFEQLVISEASRLRASLGG